ncbi:hypothetical protein AVEN_85908-1 [Araneus ventricosus]|uniref:Uncharacterized protein n=1 Tax=Araneus ventricosus TaxID=182803 RepID=A0A4Y2LKI4_ARAVE|nr:hypothetical protein AVEN_85908-1 [Araneus ventricosus]
MRNKSFGKWSGSFGDWNGSFEDWNGSFGDWNGIFAHWNEISNNGDEVLSIFLFEEWNLWPVLECGLSILSRFEMPNEILPLFWSEEGNFESAGERNGCFVVWNASFRPFLSV